MSDTNKEPSLTMIPYGEDFAEIRRSIQVAWDGQDRSRLLEMSARYVELGFTEQIFMLDPPKATMLAGKLADALPELRNVGRVRK